MIIFSGGACSLSIHEVEQVDLNQRPEMMLKPKRFQVKNNKICSRTYWGKPQCQSHFT